MSKVIPLRAASGRQTHLPVVGAIRPPAPPAAGDADALIRSLDMRAPRYTSYPTADRFVEAFGPGDYARHLGNRGLTHIGGLSLYLHVPFCESLCYYCGCNKVVTRRRDKVGPYLDMLATEADLVLEHLSGPRTVNQMHWGGGTPTYLSSDEIDQLMRRLRQRFEFAPGGEFAIEIDPRAVDAEKIAVLAEHGFNRASLGVQDFDIEVQRAVNRVQPIEVTRAALEQLRSMGFTSTNFDLIYGLPLQTPESFARTLEQVIAMRPERIALYNYAHLPSRFRAQRQINDADIPAPAVKLAIAEAALQALAQAGYIDIGMDHFALPDDEMALAQRAGTLHRNFQGYTAHPEGDLVALGVSGISRVGSCYAQNVRTLPEYADRLAQRELPILRGIELSRDDLMRRSIIMGLMCQGRVSIDSIEIANLVDFDTAFERELALLEPYVELGLVAVDDSWITITAPGRSAVRAIAAVFDRFFQSSEQRQNFSRVL
ncbi:MAG: oxygen-independent coproporphyrinogen III oxidase [Burkholderiaceae bacterium]